MLLAQGAGPIPHQVEGTVAFHGNLGVRICTIRMWREAGLGKDAAGESATIAAGCATQAGTGRGWRLDGYRNVRFTTRWSSAMRNSMGESP